LTLFRSGYQVYLHQSEVEQRVQPERNRRTNTLSPGVGDTDFKQYALALAGKDKIHQSDMNFSRRSFCLI